MGLLYALESIRIPFLDTLMSAVTQFGGEMVYMVLAIAAFWCVSKSLGYYMLTVGFVGTIANQFLKIVCRVPRPWVQDPDFTIVESARAAATGYSFPSGHTQNVFSSFGCLGMWVKKTWLRVLCAAIIILVAFSRMYLGVHTPADVGIGAAMGLVCMLAFYPVFKNMDEKPGRMYALFAVMTALILAYTVFVETWGFPADTDAANLASARKNGYTLLGAVTAMFVCFHIDRKYLHFPTAAPVAAQIVKVVAGLLLVLVVKEGLKAPLNALFNGSNAANAVRYFLTVFFAAGVWPLTFRWFAGWGSKKKSAKASE